MDIKLINETDYKVWDEFCEKNSLSTFWHTTTSMNYYINSSFNVKSEQKSFMVYDDNKILACIPLFIETSDGKINFSYGGGPIPAPIISENLNKSTASKLKKIIFDNIDKIAYENKANKLIMYVPYLSNKYINQIQKYNYLLQYGYLDISDLTCVLNLCFSEKELFCNFSKGHKSDVKKAEKNLQLQIIDKTNVSKEQIYDFMNYYYKIAGKRTRPIDTFDSIYRWIKNDYGVLLKANYNEYVCGYSLFIIYKDTSYYAMACKDKNYSEFNISHFLQWEAIKYLKNKGILYLEIGTQYFNDTLNNFPSEKDKNISKFKRGFGGVIIPVLKAEKFYDKNEFIKCYEERVHTYAERNFPNKSLE